MDKEVRGDITSFVDFVVIYRHENVSLYRTLDAYRIHYVAVTGERYIFANQSGFERDCGGKISLYSFDQGHK